MLFSTTLAALLSALGPVTALPAAEVDSSTANSGCFPGIGFRMPATVPSSPNGWWCPQNQEYGFVGFSYAIDACKSYLFCENMAENIV